MTQITNKSQNNKEEIDLADLIKALWSARLFIIISVSIFSAASIFYALSKPNIYSSSALLVPAAQEGGASGLSGLAGQLGGLASLAGVSLGGSTGINKTELAMEIMKTRTFVNKFIESHDLLVPLMAVQGWDGVNNELIINGNIYDINKHKWINSDGGISFKPSAQEAYSTFRNNFNISQDKLTSLVTVSFQHLSPSVAKQWVDWIIESINAEMKSRDLLEAHKSIDYLEQQIEKTKINHVETVLYQIIEEQMKTIMFAEIREQYAFKTIDPAQIPEQKSGPKRAMIVILWTIFGTIISVFVVLIRYFKNLK